MREDSSKPEKNRDQLYREATATYQGGLARLARAYEADGEKRRDLLQEIHLSLWRSFEVFEGKCSMRTWVYRVAHNTAVSYVLQQSRTNSLNLVSLEEFDLGGAQDNVRAAEQRIVFDQLLGMIQRLRPLDRQVMLLYLEDMDALTIGEIVGISPGNVRTLIHRIKGILARRFGGR